MLEATAPNSETATDHSPAHVELRDPWVWCIALPLIFGALASIRLTLPGQPFFDETHYVPAAREWLTLLTGGEGLYVNPEHPPLGKQLLALSMYLFGDNPMGWRALPLVAGALTVGASMRALWHASHDRFATAAFGILLASGFHVLIHARIAMLDIFMAAFLSIAAWFFAASIRKPETGRWRLAICGIAIGAALASKWAAVPLAMVPGLAFFAARLSAGRRRLLTSTRGVPVPGISLVEAFVWLGLVPLAVYALTYVPGAWLGTELNPSIVAQKGFIELHQHMLELQGQVVNSHPYQSTWPQWVLNTRVVWYLYEFTDNAQRGVMYVGNPLTMLLGLPAMVWCLVMGFYRSDWAKIAVVVGYAVSLGLWLIAPKPIQFYYHYIMPSFFLLAALALSLSDLAKTDNRAAGIIALVIGGVTFWLFSLVLPSWDGTTIALIFVPVIAIAALVGPAVAYLRATPSPQIANRTLSYLTLAGSIAVFAYFYPVLTAAELGGPMSFTYWAWFDGWR